MTPHRYYSFLCVFASVLIDWALSFSAKKVNLYLCVAFPFVLGALQRSEESVLFFAGQSGGIGRHEGLKIPWLLAVRVQVSSLVRGLSHRLNPFFIIFRVGGLAWQNSGIRGTH